MKVSNETKTGILVLICLTALGGLLMRVGNASWFEKGYVLRARFHFTEGVKKNAPVRFCGVDVGEVRGLQIIDGDETLIEVSLWVRQGTRVRQNSKVLISQLGLMGEKYVEIRSGTPESPYAQEGDVLPSEDPVRFDDLIEIGRKVAGDIGAVSQKIGSAADHVGSLAKNIDGTITENKPKIGNIFDNLEQTSDYFVEFSQDVKHHPWKVLAKGKERSKEELKRERLDWRLARGKSADPALEPETAGVSGPAGSVSVKQNFAAKNR